MPILNTPAIRELRGLAEQATNQLMELLADPEATDEARALVHALAETVLEMNRIVWDPEWPKE